MKKLLCILAVVFTAFQTMANDINASVLSLSKSKPSQHVEFRYYGFYGVMGYTMLTNFNTNEAEDSYMMHGLTAVAGFQWRDKAGVGLGFTYLNDGNKAFSQLPVFIELRSHYLRSRLTPYTAVQLGYSIPFGVSDGSAEYIKINKGGVSMGFEVGGRYAFSRNFAINFHVGYQFISLQEVERAVNNEPATRMPEVYHNLKAGIGFNF